MYDWLKEAALIILTLGGLEIVLFYLGWRKDSRIVEADDLKQNQQLDTMQDLLQEISELNDKTPEPKPVLVEQEAKPIWPAAASARES